MFDRRPLSLAPHRKLYRAMLCLAFLMLVTPVFEQAHADQCEQHACHVCTISAGGELPPAIDCATTVRPALGQALAYHGPDLHLDSATSDTHSRGPPLTGQP